MIRSDSNPLSILAVFIVLLLAVATLPLATAPASANGQTVVSDPNAPPWTESTGSLNGVIHCFAEDPVNNVVYACHYRGMFRSFDRGLTWERAGQFDLPSTAPDGGLLHRHYLSVAVASDGTVFVGNQEGNGQGLQPFWTGMVRQSTDFGDTWETITPESTHAHRAEINQDTAVVGLAVDTENPDPAKKDLVYFCSGNKLYRSNTTNHVVDPAWANVDPTTGNPIGPQPEINWSQIVPTRAMAGNATGGLGSEDNDCTDLLIHGGALFMATTEGVWRSTNYSDPLPVGGPPDPSNITWTRITDGTPIESVGAQSLLVDGSGHLFVGTTNGAAGAQGIYASADPTAASPAFTRIQVNNGLTMTMSAGGALVAARYESGFWVLSRATDPLAEPETPRAFISNGAVSQDLVTLSDGTMLYATDGLGVLRSEDEGLTWAKSNEGLHHFHWPEAVDTTGRIYAASGKGMAYSDDDGKTFTDCGQINEGSLDYDRLIFLDTVVLADQAVLSVVKGRGSVPGLWRSDDRCQTWQRGTKTSDGGPDNQLKLGTNGELYSFDESRRAIRSTDGGVTWIAGATLPRGDRAQSLNVAPNGDIWALSGWTRASRSTDGGTTWTEMSDMPLNRSQTGLKFGEAFAFGPDGTVYLAVQGGLFKLNPGGQAFEATGLNGLYGLSSVARDSAGRLYVAASNINDFARMGIYTSIDDGATWTFEPESIKDRFRLDVWVNPQTDTAIVSGAGENLHYRSRPTTPTPGLATWNPNNRQWKVHAPDGSSLGASTQLGTGDAVALAGDVNGDGQDDYITFRPGSATWSAMDVDGTVLVDSLVWGNPDNHNHALVGDVDGNGDDDFVIWDESVGRFFSVDSDGTPLVGNIRHGNPGQVPLLGDTDGDGRDDFVIWNPTSAQWYVIDSDGVTKGAWGLRWGSAGDVPLIGNVDGNDTDDFVVWRPGNGRWYAKAADGSELVNFIQWGRYFDTPLIGDIDGDGKDDFIVWRAHNQRWFAKSADDTVLLNTLQSGSGSDTPLYLVLAA